MLLFFIIVQLLVVTVYIDCKYTTRNPFIHPTETTGQYDYCKVNVDCPKPFSECNSMGVCQCKSGFRQDMNTGTMRCIPTRYFCTGGRNPIFNSQGIPTKCFSNNKSTCKGSSECLLYGDGTMATIGHCCSTEYFFGQAPKRCPVGNEIPQTECINKKGKGYIYKSGFYNSEVCCPRPCEYPAILFNGQCVLENAKIYGEECEQNFQCQHYHGMCHDDRCDCEPGKTFDSRTKYCVPTAQAFGHTARFRTPSTVQPTTTYFRRQCQSDWECQSGKCRISPVGSYCTPY